MWEQLVMTAAQACISIVADEIRNAPIGRAESAPPASPESPGCPACRAHAEAAEARGLLEAMPLRADTQGRVPGHVASTVRVAAASLDVSAVMISRVVEARPDLADQADRARQANRAARQALPTRDELTTPGGAARADQAAAVVREAWLEAHALSTAFFAPAATGDEPAASPESARLSLAS